MILFGKKHIQGFCYGKKSYTRILLWENVIYRDFVMGKSHTQGFCCGRRSYKRFLLWFGSGLAQVWFRFGSGLAFMDH